eukprot:GHUV01037820.1.p1 GENE.GHUV01037820.1~~GHUV01037820.1.p1  ORF type:complete len:140 (-),score=31.38 GHUV01037820.1:291-710(-)
MILAAARRSSIDVPVRSPVCCSSFQVDGETHVLHTEEEAMGTRLVMDTLSCLIAKEADPSRLMALSPGKLVRQLVQNGEHVDQGQAFAELEVMKMMMPLVCPAAGVIHFQVGLKERLRPLVLDAVWNRQQHACGQLVPG